MKTLFKTLCLLPIFILAPVSNIVSAQNLDNYKYSGSFNPDENLVTANFQFNGYTNYWHDTYKEEIRYGNLFKIAIPNLDKTIAQSKVDIAEDMIIPGLSLQ